MMQWMNQSQTTGGRTSSRTAASSQRAVHDRGAPAHERQLLGRPCAPQLSRAAGIRSAASHAAYARSSSKQTLAYLSGQRTTTPRVVHTPSIQQGARQRSPQRDGKYGDPTLIESSRRLVARLSAYREFRERSRAKQPADSSAADMRDSGETSSPEALNRFRVWQASSE